RLLRRHDAAAVAFVEPLRLYPGLALPGFSTLEPHPEHLHGIGRLRRHRACVHPIARVGRSEVREARSGQEDARGIGMVDGGTNASFIESGAKIDRLAIPG